MLAGHSRNGSSPDWLLRRPIRSCPLLVDTRSLAARTAEIGGQPITPHSDDGVRRFCGGRGHSSQAAISIPRTFAITLGLPRLQGFAAGPPTDNVTEPYQIYIFILLMYNSDMQISIYQIGAERKRWQDTSFARPDGRIEYREKKEFGNRHAVFERGAYFGTVHHDQFNATDVPFGTIRHISNYVDEQTGIKHTLPIVGGLALGLYLLYRSSK